MNTIYGLRSILNDGFTVQFDVSTDQSNAPTHSIENEISEINKLVAENQLILDELAQNEESLTSNADKIDYMIAVSCGIAAGLVDSFFVGEWNYKDAHIWSDIEVNKRVIQFAKNHPDYERFCNYGPKGGVRRKPLDPDRLQTAIDFLEDKFPLPGDGAYSKSSGHGISGATHRIDDWCHHPSLLGLISCIITQFTGKGHFVKSSREHWFPIVQVNEYPPFEGDTLITKIFSGVINWFFLAAKTIANRKGHMMSDIATNAGLPSGVVSLLIELASLPCFKSKHLYDDLRHAYTKGIGTGKDQIDLGVLNSLFEGASSKMDLRAEMAIQHELKRQGIPVVINEMLVRAAYFIRRFIAQMHTKKRIADLNWKALIPSKNRTISRMLTIATGVFVTVDLSDAAIRSLVETGVIRSPDFLPTMILRVNFVGIGRFTIALSNDCYMGFKRHRILDKQIKLNTVQIYLYSAKTYYRQAEVWVSAIDTEIALQESIKSLETQICTYRETVAQNEQSFVRVESRIEQLRKEKPDLIQSLLEEL